MSRDLLSLIMRQEDVPETVARWATTCRLWAQTARERLAAMKRLQFLDSAAYDECDRFQWMTTLPGGNFCVAAPESDSALLVFGPDGTILSTMQMPAVRRLGAGWRGSEWAAFLRLVGRGCAQAACGGRWKP